jgi:hypothetical protein
VQGHVAIVHMMQEHIVEDKILCMDMSWWGQKMQSHIEWGQMVHLHIQVADGAGTYR